MNTKINQPDKTKKEVQRIVKELEALQYIKMGKIWDKVWDKPTQRKGLLATVFVACILLLLSSCNMHFHPGNYSKYHYFYYRDVLGKHDTIPYPYKRH